MRSILLYITTLVLVSVPVLVQAQQTTILEIRIKGLDVSTALFGSLKGSTIKTIDTLRVSDGTIRTVVRKPHRGVYRVQYHDSLYIELLLTGDSLVRLETSVNDIFRSMKVEGSPENELFYDYWKNRLLSDDSLNRIAVLGNSLMQQSGGKPTPTLDSLQARYSAILSRQKAYIDEVIYEYRGWLAAALIRAYQIPDYQGFLATSPVYLSEVDFYRNHFFDNIDFDEPGLVNSEVYYIAINDYLANFAKPPKTNTYLDACAAILDAAKGQEPFYGYALNLLIQNFEYTVWEAVFAGLVEEYYLGYEGRHQAMADYYREKASAIRSLQPGKPAPQLVLPDTSGEQQSLYMIPGSMKILLFWSGDCEHCEEIMPDLKRLAEKYRSSGLSVVAVSVDDLRELWLKGIEENSTGAWYHLSDLSGLTGQFAADFNIWMTPVIYLLDADNTIVKRPYSILVLEQELEDYYSEE